MCSIASRAPLLLTEVEREHVFLLALGRPPEVRYQAAEGVTPRLQRVLDALQYSPAYVKTSTWDIVAWNRAATVVLADYAAMQPEQRNILRLIFCNSRIRAAMPHWDSDARFVVAAFRADLARAGATKTVEALVAELCRISPEFETMWHDHDVRSAYGERAKHVQHAEAGLIELDYSAFGVDGRQDLGVVVYTPSTLGDLEKVKELVGWE